MSAEQKYLAHRENFKVTFDLAGEYAKWLLSTMLLLNSGAIAGIFQRDPDHANRVALGFFAPGVLFALLSGIFGWFNLQYAATHYHFAAIETLAGTAEPHQPRSITATRQAAIAAAIVSIGCLALGAIVVVLTI